jgi:hypothetical protein
MQLYKDYQPTGYDIKGLNQPDKQNWLVVPLILTRDSEVLERANWIAATKMFERGLNENDDDYDDYEECHFNHWACGWFQIIVVAPDSPAHDIAKQIESRLEEYSILDEDLTYEMELTEFHDLVEQAAIEAINDLDDEKDCDLTLNTDKFCPSVLAEDLRWDIGGRIPLAQEIFDSLKENMFIWSVPRKRVLL